MFDLAGAGFETGATERALRHLVAKATFHVSTIRHCVVMINMSDIRSRKTGNGL
jgi:hypothetical protein